MARAENKMARAGKPCRTFGRWDGTCQPNDGEAPPPPIAVGTEFKLFEGVWMAVEQISPIPEGLVDDGGGLSEPPDWGGTKMEGPEREVRSMCSDLLIPYWESRSPPFN